MSTEFQRKIAQRYGGNARVATPAEIHRAMHPGDSLSGKEKEQIDDIVERTGLSVTVVLAYFVSDRGRYCGERKKAFINAVQAARQRHGKDISLYITVDDFTHLGHIRNLGEVLARRPRK